MPLLTSPISGAPMRQIYRYGIEIDVCPTSGGIWLDKGELEKILHLLNEENQASQANSHNQQPQFLPQANSAYGISKGLPPSQLQPQFISQHPSNAQNYYPKDQSDNHDKYKKYERDDDDYRHYKQHGYYGSGKYYKKEGKMSKLLDLFDF